MSDETKPRALKRTIRDCIVVNLSGNGVTHLAREINPGAADVCDDVVGNIPSSRCGGRVNTGTDVRGVGYVTVRNGSAVLVIAINSITIGAFDTERVHGVSISQDDAAVEQRLHGSLGVDQSGPRAEKSLPVE